MTDIWRECEGERHIALLRTQALRLVESQEQIATLGLVDNLEEQEILEHLLDSSKPPAPPGAQRHHYLIMTPFRYPPLPWGSRFGNRLRPGIFYASITIDTLLAEAAYYRFLFWQGMSAPPPADRLNTQHTLFSIQVKTPSGLGLEQPPFQTYQHLIAHPSDYYDSQQLGDAMREAGVEAFTYPSARDATQGLNVGVFTPNAIVNERPTQEQWLCLTRADEVSFRQQHDHSVVYRFAVDQFQRDGNLPQPA